METLIWRKVDAADIKISGEGSGTLIELKGELTIHEEVVIDRGQASAQLKLRLLIAKVHGSCQGEVVITCCIKWVLREKKEKIDNSV